MLISLLKKMQWERKPFMSIDCVREYLGHFGRADDILEFDSSSATVELAADAAGVRERRMRFDRRGRGR